MITSTRNHGYKAYSYCGTIIKNYLIYKINQYVKNQKRNTSYDAYNAEELSSINDTLRYSYNNSVDANNRLLFLNELMKRSVNEINKIMESGKTDNNFKLTENEVKVGNALVDLMSNWEEIFSQMGSDKFNKSSILLYLRESTFLSTKEIRDGMKKYKAAYYDLKKNLLDNF